MATITIDGKVYEYNKENIKGKGQYCHVYIANKKKGTKAAVGIDLDQVALKVLKEEHERLKEQFLIVGQQNQRIKYGDKPHPHFHAPLYVGEGEDEKGKKVVCWALRPASKTLYEFLTEQFPQGQNDEQRIKVVANVPWVQGAYYFLLNGLKVVQAIENSGVEKGKMDVKPTNTLVMDGSIGEGRQPLSTFEIADPISLEEAGTMSTHEFSLAYGQHLGLKRILGIAYWILTGERDDPTKLTTNELTEINPLVSAKLTEVIWRYSRKTENKTIDACISECTEIIEKTGLEADETERVPYFGVIEGKGAYDIWTPVEYFDKRVLDGGSIEKPSKSSRYGVLKQRYETIKQRDHLMREMQETLKTKVVSDGDEQAIAQKVTEERERLEPVYGEIKKQLGPELEERTREKEKLEEEICDINQMCSTSPVTVV